MNIYNVTLDELEKQLVDNGFKKFNARQLYEWVYKKKVFDIRQMSNLSKQLRDFLAINMENTQLNVTSHQKSSDGTEKFLFKTEDNNTIETVLMRHDYGNSVCVTTQIGCNIGCSFCASGLHKKKRDLLASEMVQQVLKVEEIVQERISHVVIMGIGEPFDNYQNSMRFIEIINSPYGLEIGARHITISTSGIVDKIKKFADEKLQVNLAISLHASNNMDRSVLMKINNTYNIEDVIEAAKYYVQKTNRRITFEYILLDNMNDSIVKANELSDLLRGINCYVNLIPYNSVKEFQYKGSSIKKAIAFKNQLLKRGINVTLRKEKGADIDAACGQLRSEKMEEI
jgi:23S rRNA (adenine2503-C2)-methyltransferase